MRGKEQTLTGDERDGSSRVYINTGVPCALKRSSIVLSLLLLFSGHTMVTWKFQYALITYAQCGNLDPWSIVELFTTLGAECIIGRENHADGGIHLHCFVDFGRQFRSRRQDIFDVAGRHPNVQHVGRTPWVAYDYCIKDGDVVAGGAERPIERGDKLSKTDEIWTIIMGAKTREEFFRLCQQMAPAKLATSFSSISAFADWKYQVVHTKYEHPEGCIFIQDRVEPLYRWAQENLGIRTGGKFFVVIPPSASLRGGPERVSAPPGARSSGGR